MHNITEARVRKLIGKSIYAKHKNGTVSNGKLLNVKGDRIILDSKIEKNVNTKGILPLLLFDLLLIGISRYGYGIPPYGYGIPPYGYGYGGYPNGFYGYSGYGCKCGYPYEECYDNNPDGYYYR